MEHRNRYGPKLLFMLSMDTAEFMMFGNDAVPCSIYNSDDYY